MTRSTALIICLGLAVLFHANSATTNSDIIKGDVKKTADAVKATVEGLTGDITSQVTVLTGLVDVTAITTLITGLQKDILQVVSDVQSTAGAVVEKALTTLLNAVDTIKNAVAGVIPSLNDIVKSLTALLQQVVELVNSLLQAVFDLLGGLTSKLQGVLQGTLTQITSLGVSILDDVAGVVESQLVIVNSAFGTIQDFVAKDVIIKLPQLSQTATALVTSVLGRLFSLQTLISGLIQSVLQIVFSLVATLKDALENILNPVVGSLSDVLTLVGGCSSCLGGGGLLGGLLGVGRRRRYIA